MRHQLVRLTKLIGLLLAAVLAYSTVQLPMLAYADTAPPNPADPKTPVSVSADPLPTVQINGVAWTQRVIGNTVYVGGKFTTARPAGAAPGVNTVTRTNLLAYDIRTGVLINTWAPTTNGDVLDIVAVAGRLAALHRRQLHQRQRPDPQPDRGAQPDHRRADHRLQAEARRDRPRDRGHERHRLLRWSAELGQQHRPAASAAAVKASDGALLLGAAAAGGSVHAMILSPDGSRVIVGGAFTTMNGSANPGYGLASIDPVTGAIQPFNANSLVRNAGANAAITGLSTDGDSLYVSGFVFGSGGNLEGVARIDWNAGNIVVGRGLPRRHVRQRIPRAT